MPKAATLDPVFAFYAKTSALHDARRYLQYGTRRLAEYDLPARTIEVLGELRQLEPGLAGRDNTSADKTRVTALIARFKTSIPDWTGTPWKYGTPLDRMIRKATARGVGQDALDRLRAWYVGHLPTTDPFGRCLPRLVPLTPDEVQAALQAAIPVASSPLQAVGKAAPRAAHTAAGTVSRVPCPTPRCRGTVSAAGDRRVTCRTCAASWTLLPVGFFDRTPADRSVRKPEVSRKQSGVSRKVLTGGRAAVDWRAAGLKAAETRRRNLALRAAAPAAEQAAA